MIFYDLDGVIRDLCTPIWGRQAHEWNEKKDGMGLIEYVYQDLDILREAPPTEYYQTIFAQPSVRILTCQPIEWRNPTREWLEKYFGAHCDVEAIFVSAPSEKLARLKPSDVLVEDYPFFEDYSQIALIDRPYNQNVKAPIRIRNSRDLGEFLWGFGFERYLKQMCGHCY